MSESILSAALRAAMLTHMGTHDVDTDPYGAADGEPLTKFCDALADVMWDYIGGGVLYNGTVYYVNKAGDDGNSGTTPADAFLTIGAGFSAMASGDALSVAQGTYTEVALDLDVIGGQLWCQPGVTLAPASGTVLAVSGDGARVRGEHDALMRIEPTSGNVGLLLSGDACVARHVNVVGDSALAGVRITGDECELNDNKVAGIAAGGKAFDLTGGKITARKCNTVGVGPASYGYYVLSVGGLLDNCISMLHSESGFYFDTGTAGWIAHDCSSGVGDGRWRDIDEVNQLDIKYDDKVEAVLDIAQGGAGTHTYELFKVTGVVKLLYLVAVVEDTLAGTNTNCYLDIASVNGGDSLSKNLTLTLNAALEGSFIGKLDLASRVLAFHNADAGFLVEGIDPTVEGIRLGEDRTGGAHVATYVRFTHTTTGASSGEIHWYLRWAPESDDGFVEAA